MEKLELQITDSDGNVVHASSSSEPFTKPTKEAFMQNVIDGL